MTTTPTTPTATPMKRKIPAGVSENDPLCYQRLYILDTLLNIMVLFLESENIENDMDDYYENLQELVAGVFKQRQEIENHFTECSITALDWHRRERLLAFIKDWVEDPERRETAMKVQSLQVLPNTGSLTPVAKEKISENGYNFHVSPQMSTEAEAARPDDAPKNEKIMSENGEKTEEFDDGERRMSKKKKKKKKKNKGNNGLQNSESVKIEEMKEDEQETETTPATADSKGLVESEKLSKLPLIRVSGTETNIEMPRDGENTTPGLLEDRRSSRLMSEEEERKGSKTPNARLVRSRGPSPSLTPVASPHKDISNKIVGTNLGLDSPAKLQDFFQDAATITPVRLKELLSIVTDIRFDLPTKNDDKGEYYPHDFYQGFSPKELYQTLGDQITTIKINLSDIRCSNWVFLYFIEGLAKCTRLETLQITARSSNFSDKVFITLQEQLSELPCLKFFNINFGRNDNITVKAFGCIRTGLSASSGRQHEADLRVEVENKNITVDEAKAVFSDISMNCRVWINDQPQPKKTWKF